MYKISGFAKFLILIVLLLNVACSTNIKKDESRLLEVFGSIPSMCLHVSVLCLDAWHSEKVRRAAAYLYGELKLAKLTTPPPPVS